MADHVDVLLPRYVHQRSDRVSQSLERVAGYVDHGALQAHLFGTVSRFLKFVEDSAGVFALFSGVVCRRHVIPRLLTSRPLDALLFAPIVPLRRVVENARRQLRGRRNVGESRSRAVAVCRREKPAFLAC